MIQSKCGATAVSNSSNRLLAERSAAMSPPSPPGMKQMLFSTAVIEGSRSLTSSGNWMTSCRVAFPER